MKAFKPYLMHILEECAYSKLPGAGFFNYSKNRVLTKEGCLKSYWDLPTFFRNLEISYHSNNSWMSDGTFKSERTRVCY